MPIKLKKNMVNQEFISRQDTYNMKIGGMGCRGFIPTEEHKAKISAAQRSRVSSKKQESKRLNAKLSVKRHEKLSKYAESQDKDMTSVIECWIDSLPEVKVLN